MSCKFNQKRGDIQGNIQRLELSWNYGIFASYIIVLKIKTT